MDFKIGSSKCLNSTSLSLIKSLQKQGFKIGASWVSGLSICEKLVFKICMNFGHNHRQLQFAIVSLLLDCLPQTTVRNHQHAKNNKDLARMVVGERTNPLEELTRATYHRPLRPDHYHDLQLWFAMCYCVGLTSELKRFLCHDECTEPTSFAFQTRQITNDAKLRATYFEDFSLLDEAA